VCELTAGFSKVLIPSDTATQTTRGKGLDMWAVMLVRHWDYDRKVYIACKGTLHDRSKALAEEYCGLKLSEWKVMWYDEENDPDIYSEFLTPDDKPSI
jgi:hypothetical protein